MSSKNSGMQWTFGKDIGKEDAQVDGRRYGVLTGSSAPKKDAAGKQKAFRDSREQYLPTSSMSIDLDFIPYGDDVTPVGNKPIVVPTSGRTGDILQTMHDSPGLLQFDQAPRIEEQETSGASALEKRRQVMLSMQQSDYAALTEADKALLQQRKYSLSVWNAFTTQGEDGEKQQLQGFGVARRAAQVAGHNASDSDAIIMMDDQVIYNPALDDGYNTDIGEEETRKRLASHRKKYARKMVERNNQEEDEESTDEVPTSRKKRKRDDSSRSRKVTRKEDDELFPREDLYYSAGSGGDDRLSRQAAEKLRALKDGSWLSDLGSGRPAEQVVVVGKDAPYNPRLAGGGEDIEQTVRMTQRLGKSVSRPLSKEQSARLRYQKGGKTPKISKLDTQGARQREDMSQTGRSVTEQVKPYPMVMQDTDFYKMTARSQAQEMSTEEAARHIQGKGKFSKGRQSQAPGLETIARRMEANKSSATLSKTSAADDQLGQETVTFSKRV